MASAFDVTGFLEAAGRIQIPIDTFLVELRRVPGNDVAVLRGFDVTKDVTERNDSIFIQVSVPLQAQRESFSLLVLAQGGGVVWYEIRDTVDVGLNETSATESLDPVYVGPGANATGVLLQLSDTIIAGGDSVLATATVLEGQTVVAGVPVGFSSSDTLEVADPRVVPPNQAWVTAPRTLEDSVIITARTPTGLTASLPLRFYPPAETLEAVAGDGQTLLGGAVAPEPLTVRVLDASGLPFRRGRLVRFAVQTGPTGTALSADSVVTDTAAIASTVLTAGTAAGTIQVTATASGLLGSPVIFTATVGDVSGPASITIAGGDAQAATVATTLPVNPAVLVTDGASNPAAGVQVTFAVASGGGSITGATPTTDANGLAALGSWTLGQTAGSNTLTATVVGLTPVTFTATGAPDVPDTIVAITGSGQTADAGTLLPNPLVAEVRDQFANTVPGIIVSWSASDGTVTPASATTDAAGRAQAAWTLGTNAVTQTATATVSGLTPAVFDATAVVPPTSILLRLVGTSRVGVGRTETLEITLTTPAPIGGLTVALSSDAPGILSVSSPGSVSIAEGGTTGQIGVTGVAEGTTTLRATAPGYTDGALGVQVSLQVLSMPSTLNVPFGGTASIPVQISTPAPSGGVAVTLVSSDPNAVGVVTPTVTIPEGLQTANGTLSGVAPGTAALTGSTAVFGTAQSVVTTTANLNITQSSVVLNASFTATILIRLESAGAPIPAPAGGIPVTVAGADPGCVAATSPVTIPAGLVDVTATLSYGGAATLPCTTTVTASATDIAADNVSARVDPTPGITLNTAATGSGLQRGVSGSLGASNHGGVTLRLTSLDPQVLRLSANATTPGADFIDIPVAIGTSSFSFLVQGVEGATGQVGVTATAPGFNDGTALVDVLQPALEIIGLTSASTTLSPDDPFQVRVGIPNTPTSPSFMTAELDVRAGAPAALTATLTSSDAAVGQLATTDSIRGTVSVTIPVGQSRTAASVATGGAAFDPVATGTTTVGASVPGHLALPQAAIGVTVTAPQITLNTAATGSGLQRGVSGSLGASNHGGVTVRLTSADPQLLLLAPNATTTGAAFIDVPVADGTTFFSFVVQGVEGAIGQVGVTAAAPGFNDGAALVDVLQPAVEILGLASAITTLSPDDPFQVRVGIPNAPTSPSFLTAELDVRAGAPAALTATITSSDAAVGQLVTADSTRGTVSVAIPAGQSRTAASVATGGAAFDPATAGATTVSASIPGYLPLPQAAIAVTVTAPGITLNTAPTGSGLQRSVSGSLGASNHGGATVRLTSADPQVLRLSPNATTAGTDFIDVPVADGATFFSFIVHGVEGAIGQVGVTATAPGFNNGTALVDVLQPALEILGLAGAITTLSPDDPFQVRVGIPNAPTSPSFLTAELDVRAGAPGPLTATIRSSLPNVGQLVTPDSIRGTVSVTIPVGQSRSAATVTTGGVAFDPLTAGTTTVAAAIPGHVALPQASIAVTVSTPAITLSVAPTGSGLQRSVSGTLGAPDHGGVPVRIVSSNSAVLLVSPNATTSGTPSIDVFVPDGTTFFSFFVQGVEGATGTPTLTASANGFTDGTAAVEVMPPALEITGLGANQTAGGADDPFQARVGIPNSTTNPTFMSAELDVRTGAPGPLTATIRNSNDQFGQLIVTGQMGGTVSVQIVAGQSRSPASVANGGVAFDPIAQGTTTVSASIPGVIALPLATVSVTVSP